MEPKKVLLFLFEGVTDKIALENILKRIFSSSTVDVEFLGTDITSDKNVPLADVDNRLRNFVREKIRQLHIDLEDIEKIIHVIDTDGGFVDENYIQYKEGLKKIEYTNKEILSKDTAQTLKRNKDKTEKVNFLKNKSYLLFKAENKLHIDYRVFYFSRNREHALMNKDNELTNEEKADMALSFASSFLRKESEFIILLNDSSIKVDGTYEQTWSYIQESNNSLHRHSNFHLAF
jgi:hypothetical protein